MIFNIFKDNSIETLNKITSRYGIVISHVDDLFCAVFDLILKNQIGTIEIPIDDQKTIFNAIKKYSDWGYFKATINLAECYLFGFGLELTELTVNKGLSILKKITSLIDNDPSIMCIHGYTIVMREGLKSEGIRILKQAAEHGEARAYYFLGMFYYFEGTKNSEALAVEMFESALKNRFFSVWRDLFFIYAKNGEDEKVENLLKGLVDRNDLPYHIVVEIRNFESSHKKFLESDASGDNE